MTLVSPYDPAPVHRSPEPARHRARGRALAVLGAATALPLLAAAPAHASVAGLGDSSGPSGYSGPSHSVSHSGEGNGERSQGARTYVPPRGGFYCASCRGGDNRR